MLERWNEMDRNSALEAVTDCCGARRWAAAIVDLRPIDGEAELYEAADRLWSIMTESDWLEAFLSHPRIGERKAPVASIRSSTWSGEEQSTIQGAADTVLSALAEGNARYESKFGFTYIVCATGKSPEEMLSILEGRLVNTRAVELYEAAKQQRQIMHLRLRKWLEQ